MAEPPAAIAVIPGLPPEASARLLAVLSAEHAVREVWLYGSRAMGRQRPGSDIDLTLVAPGLNHQSRLRLMGALDDLLLTEGNAGLISSRDTLRLAFRMGLMDDGEGWLAMVQDRNLTSHTYNRSNAAAEEGDG